MSAGKAVIQIFDRYQKERVLFVQSVADLATRPQNVEALMNAGVMALLRPLLLDNVPSIQQSAALALGRLANYNDDLAEAVVSNDILPQLVYQLSEQNRFYKKAAAFVLRAVAKHSPQLAKAVVDSGSLDALVGCLEEFDPGVKEAAAWALGYIARHNYELAQQVVDSGAVPLLVLCVQEPELTQKRIAASALSDICKHSPELAQVVVDSGAIAYLAPLVSSGDSKLKHSVDLAEVVVEADIFSNGRILACLNDVDPFVRKNAATVIREIVKHTPELAQLVVSSGGVQAIVSYVNEAQGNNRLPGIMTLGYISAFSEPLALAVVVAKGIPPLVNCLVHEPEDHIKAASAWSLGQIGRHSPEHAKSLADANVFPKLLAVYLHEESSDDLKTKAKRAMKSVIEKCVHLPALEPLLHLQTPPNILKYVVHQFAKVLPHDVTARKDFVSSGAIQRLQDIEAEPGSKLKEFKDTINSCYPEEIVNYYSPNYSDTLMKKVEEFPLPTAQ